MAVKQRNTLIPGFTNAPPFLVFFLLSWPHIATQLLCLGAASLLYAFCPPVMDRVFPVFPGFEASSFGLRHSFPIQEEFINTWVMALIAYAVPALVMGAFGLWGIRDFYDANSSVSSPFRLSFLHLYLHFHDYLITVLTFIAYWFGLCPKHLHSLHQHHQDICWGVTPTLPHSL
jgi:hypothetical protein